MVYRPPTKKKKAGLKARILRAAARLPKTTFNPHTRVWTVSTPRGVSFSSVQAEIQQHIRDGVICPCCDRLAKVYKRKLNSNMAVFLLSLVKLYRTEHEPVHYSRCRFQGRDYSYILDWELAISLPPDGKETKNSGYWQPTEKGLLFADGAIAVPQHLFLHNDEMVAQSDISVTIREALGDHFDYEELMSA